MLLALVVIGAGIGLRDPWPVDEPRFVLIARDMVLSGHWFFPRVAGVLYPDKPPLFMWTIAAFYALIGHLRIAFLLPSLLAGLGTLWLVNDLGRRLWCRQAGLAAALALLATVQFTLLAKRAQIDAFECWWTTLGLYGLVRHLLLGPAWRWYYLGFAAMGLGVITKGVGFLPLLALIPYGWARLAAWRSMPRVHGRWWQWALGPLALLAAVGVWLVPMLIMVALSGNPQLVSYRDNILFHQTAVRYAHAWHHLQPAWYYAADIIPVFWLPLSVTVPWLAPPWWRRLKRRDARYLILFGWVVLVVLFFNLSAGKRGEYILPALPALALAAGPILPRLVRQKSLRWAAFALTLLFALLGVGVLVYYLALAPAKGDALVAHFQVWPWALLAAVTTWAWLCALAGRIKHAVPALCAFLLGLWLWYGFWGYPLINSVRSGAGLMHRVAAALGPEAKLGLVDWREQYVLQADRQVVHFGYRRGGSPGELADALAWVVRGPHRWLMIANNDFNACIGQAERRDVGRRNDQHWYLLNRAGLSRACRRRALQSGPPSIVVHSVRPSAPD
jgi:4-amino-4-deoxy-L-arabinose transferase-like glycosyltransferase